MTPAWPGPADQLVEDGEGVPRRAGAGAHEQRQGGRLDPDVLALAELGEVRRQQPRRDQPERVVVRAGADGRDDLLGLGGREDEPEVLGRLLDELEQGVEALRGDHVGLVDDVDLVAALDRGEERLLAQVARVVDATVGRGVDLDHVDRAAAAAAQVHAALALAAGVGDRCLLAVECPRQDPRRRRLAAPARAGEQVGVVDPVVGQGGAQRLGDVLLPDDLVEGLGPVAAVERERGVHVLATLTSRADTGHPGKQRPPAHPAELTYPCCLPTLGDWARCRHAGGCRRV